MTTARKFITVVAVAATALFISAGVAFAGPKHVDDGGKHGGHTNSHKDRYDLGDDNNCNYKYNRDGSLNKKFHGDDDSCPTIYPVTNPPNVGADPNAPQTMLPLPPLPTIPVIPTILPAF